MAESKDTYKKGLKGIAIFGGLQVYKILLSVLTTKISAVFLGPAGSGIYGLISSTTTTVESFTSCGLGTSAVKDIAQTAATGDLDKVKRTYTVLNRLVWVTGIIGTLVVAIFAGFWSELAFGNQDYKWWFAIASITIFINQLATGQGALLTGLQHYKLISHTRLVSGALCAVLVVVCYYFLGIDGIIPVIVGVALIHMVVTYVMVRRTDIRTIPVPLKDIIRLGKPMMIIGVTLGVSWALSSLSGYFVRVIISNLSDIATVGLFTASFSLVNTYLGLVFSSIESDYYPRLSRVVGNTNEYVLTMQQEIEILFYILIPLVGLMILFSHPALAIFYSTKFYAAKSIICWTAFSMVFRVPSWAMAIGLIAQGKSKLYFINQSSFIIYQFGFNVLGFMYGGLTGLGISYVISQIIFTIQNYIVQRKLSDFHFTPILWYIIGASFVIGTCFCIFVTLFNGVYLYMPGGLIMIAVCGICVNRLNKNTNLFSMIKNKVHGK